MDSSGVAPGDPVQDRDLDGDPGGPWWPVLVAPDPQRLHTDAEVAVLVESGTRLKEAVAAVAGAHGMRSRELYQAVLAARG